MASIGRVKIDPEHLRDGDGTVLRAMELWSARNGPVNYNYWQSIYFQLVKPPYGLKDILATSSRMYDPRPVPANESAKEKQTRLQRMHEEVQFDLYGPDHRAQALRNKPVDVGGGQIAFGQPPAQPGSGLPLPGCKVGTLRTKRVGVTLMLRPRSGRLRW